MISIFSKFAFQHIIALVLLPFSLMAQTPPPSAVIKKPEDYFNVNKNNSQFTEVDKISGNPNISLPLYDIELNGYSLPIGLSYNINSLKVNSISSWVGLGWSLNLGGSISRNMAGGPDDCNFYSVSGTAKMKNVGYMKGGATRANEFNLNHSTTVANSYELIKTMGTRYHLYNGGSPDIPAENGSYLGLYDTEPDEFIISIPGSTQSFYFDQNNEIKFAPYSNFKVIYSMDDTYVGDPGLSGMQNTKGIVAFAVLDDNGNLFVFDVPETTRYYSSIGYRWGLHSIYAPGTTPGPYGYDVKKYRYTINDEWKLSKIITKNSDTIKFTYADEEVYYRSINFKSKVDPNLFNASCTKQIKNQKRLLTIETKNELIKLNAFNDREDLVNTKKLDGIEIYSKLDGALSLIKKYTFYHEYFAASTSNNDMGIQNTYIDGNTSEPQDDYFSRLSLVDITESAGSPIKDRKYSFEYNTDYDLPNRLSSKVDFWGYFNNSSNSGRNSFFPTINVYPSLNGPDKFSVFDYDNVTSKYTFNGGNRMASSDSKVAWANGLKKIIFPTGGYREFDFEPNTFHYMNKNYTGGGVRLKKEIIYDHVSNSSITKEYEYTDINDVLKSSGRIINFPLFAHTENTLSGYAYNYDGSIHYANVNSLINLLNKDYYAYALAISSEPEWVLGKREKEDVQYKYIVEKLSGSQQGNGKTIYEFNPLDFKEILNDNRFFLPKSNPWIHGYYFGGFGGGLDFAGEYDSYADVRGLVFEKCAKPTTPYSSNNWIAGNLIRKSVYNSNNEIVSEDLYEYDEFKPLSANDQIKAIRIQQFENYRIGILAHISLYPNYTVNFYANDFIVYSNYKLYTNNKTILTSQESKIYSSPTNFLSKKYRYTYNEYAQKISESFTNSNFDCTTTNFTYPTSYSLPSYPIHENIMALKTMIGKNQINEIVEKTTFKNCTNFLATSSELRLFKSIANANGINVINPSQVFIFSDVNANDFTPFDVVGTNSIIKDDRYKINTKYTFDSKGLINEVFKSNGIPEAYMYDYNSSLNVAKITNSGINDVAYTSFETSNKGTWQFSSNPTLVDDATAPTGNKVFLFTGNRIIRNQLNNNKTYIVSYWTNSLAPLLLNWSTPEVINSKTINNWTYFEHKISGISSVTLMESGGVALTGSRKLDELRLYPDNAFMTTYTYKPLIGTTSVCNDKNQINYYEYGSYNYLDNIRDQDRNIVKKVCYNYFGQPEDCAPNTSTAQWVNTGNTRCKPCPQNYSYQSNIREREEKDINPQSSTYGTLHWVEDGVGSCISPPSWSQISSNCQLDPNGLNTGYQIIVEQDVNPCSNSYNQTREIISSDLVGCPTSCATVCQEPKFKCINGNCEEGFWGCVKVKKRYREDGSLYWICFYRYCFSDGSVSNYILPIVSENPCRITCL